MIRPPFKRNLRTLAIPSLAQLAQDQLKDKGVVFNFDVTEQERKAIFAIADRAVTIAGLAGTTLSQMTVAMDVMVCHCNGNPLDLEKFLHAEQPDFVDAVISIGVHLDRLTGKFMHDFKPHFARVLS